MDIGLSHVITVDGEVFNAYWDVFNPNLALGNVHEIKIFEEVLPLETLYQRLDDCIATENFLGRFYLANKNQQMYTYKADFNIGVEALDEDIKVWSFVFVSDGRPWALCNLEKAVTIRAGREALFEFQSSVTVNNNSQLITNLWDINVGKFNIKYSAMIHPVEEFTKNVLASKSRALYNQPDDQTIATVLQNGFELKPEYILQPGKIGIKLRAKTKTDVAGVKAIFIRILWNLGIMVFIDSVEYEGIKLDNLTLARGHQLQLLFGLNFKEINS